MMGKTIAMLGAALIVLGTSPAIAGIIFDNGGPSTSEFGLFSDPTADQLEGSVFTLGTDQTLRDVHWYGAYSPFDTPNRPDQFRIQLFAVAAGTPATSPFYTANVGHVGRTDTTLDNSGGRDIYFYWTVVPDVFLAAGDYLLSIDNDTTADTNDFWVWSTTGSGSHFMRANDNSAWSSSANQGDFAYHLTDDTDIPEPGTLGLMGLGLAGLGLARRRRAA